MSRRCMLAIAISYLSLVACCCPMATTPPKAKGPEKQAANDPAGVKPGAKKPIELDETPIPEPIFVFKKKELPPREFKPIVSATAVSIVDKVKVELVSGEIEVERPNAQLIIKLRIHNEGEVAFEYKPWSLGKPTSASDEHGRTYPIQVPRAEYKPHAKPVKVEARKSMEDVIAFEAPLPISQEVDFKLSGINVQMAFDSFAFKIGRPFFAKKIDGHLEKVEEARQRAVFDTEWAAEKKRIVAARKKAYDEAVAKQKQEEERIAQAERDRLAQIERKKQAAQQTVSEKLNRFMAVIDKASKTANQRVVHRVDVTGDKATITVDNSWHLVVYQVRLQVAQNLWNQWVSIASPNDPDKAGMKLVDLNGNEVGGYSVFSGVWVQK
jgi:hypothetical protein